MARRASAPAMPAVEVSEGCGPVGVGAQGRAGERRAQPRQVARASRSTSGQRRGNASTSDFSRAALEQTVRAAYDIARFTAEDPAAGLPEAAGHGHADRGRARPGPVPSLGDRRRRGGANWRGAARPRRSPPTARITNSEGAGVSAQQSHFWAGNSRGFRGGYASSRHSLSVSPIAGTGADMQRDAWYSSMRDAAELASPEAVGRYAAERALSRLKARKIATLRGAGAVRVAAGRRAARRLRAGHQRRRAVPQGELPARQPGQAGAGRRTSTSTRTRTMPRGKGSAPFDDEGVRTQRAPRGRCRRGAGLLPVELFGAQARPAHHRPRRRLAEPAR